MRRLVAVALLAFALPAAAQAAPQVRTAEFGMSVAQGGASARSAAAGIVTPPLRAPRRFDLVGASWRGGAGTVWLRARRFSGRWSRWVRLAPAEEPVRGGSGTEPVWAGGDDLVQLRSSRRLRGLRLSFVNASVSPVRSARAVRRLRLSTGGSFAILRRAAWGASHCKPRAAPFYGRVDLAVVHHTESLNGYSRSQSPAIVLGICLFHRDTRGWNDIGYNFLVDRFGQVFEGRAGGMTEPVIGAQAGGFNQVSTGVAAIGDFRFRAFPRAGMNSLARLLAWRLSLNGVPAVGRVTVLSGGGVFTPFRSGTAVTVHRISGHRNVDSTECPGNALYAQLPGLRALVSRLEGPVSRLDLAGAQLRLVYPQPLTFSGRLTPAAGLSVPTGAGVAIQDGLRAGGRTLAVLPLAPDGTFAGSLPLTHSDVLQAVFLGGGGLPPLISAPIAVNVAPAVSLQASAPAVVRGTPVTLSGAVSPAAGRVSLVEQQLRGPRFRRVRAFNLKATAGAYSKTLLLRRAGTFRFVARTAASRRMAAGASAPVVVTVSG